MNLTWKARTDPFMKWFTFTLFVIWLIVGVVWLASSLKDARRKFTQSLNTKQRRLSWVFVALFVLSLLIVPWRVDAQLLGFPIYSHFSYGLIWSPPFGGISPDVIGIISPQGGILLGLILVEWLVLIFSYCYFFRVFKHSASNDHKT